MRKFLFLIALLAGSYVVTQAQPVGLFLDEPLAEVRSVNSTPNTTIHYTVRQKTGGTGDITFATSVNGTYSDPLNYSITTNGSGFGQTTIYTKGVTTGTATAEENINLFPGVWFDWNLPYSITTISSVTLTAINQPTLDTNPNASNGLRVYPDGNGPGDSTDRRAVKVTATMANAVAGIPIIFKSFDVDDPSAAGDAVDPDTGGAGSGLDNRIASGQNGIMQVSGSGSTNEVVAYTNSSGVAEANLIVSMHPGDNYRVAASGNVAALNDIRVDGTILEDSSNNALPLTKVKGTDMLTVWRTLHLEVDRMAAPSGNSGWNIMQTGWTGGGQTIVQAYYNTFEPGQYENGWIYFDGLDDHGVSTNSANAPYGDLVFVQSELDPVWAYEEQEFTIVDDDDYNDDDSPNDGDGTEAAPIAHLDAMDNLTSTNVFAPAYITVVNDGGGIGGNNNTTAFHVNPDEEDLDDIFDAKYGSWPNGADNFWVAYLVMGYQGEAATDNDPVSEVDEELGVTKAVADDDIGAGCVDVPLGGFYSFVWQETVRDYFVQESDPVDDLTAPHEIGHQLGLEDRSGNYLMSDTANGFSTLHPNDIHILRCRTKAPGRS